MTRWFQIILSGMLSCILISQAVADDHSANELKSGEFVLKVLVDVDATSVKNQSRTGTCWTFSTNSFLESELLRMGKDPVDLSEMFVVRKTYPQKAQRYVRLHGNGTLGAGSLGGDVLRVIRDHGMVPEVVYDGKFEDEELHNHNELDAVLKAMLNTIIKNPGKKLSPVWPKAVEGVLDAYLGEAPETFKYAGKTYTPRSFADQMGINPDDYIEFTSFSHHPYYQNIAVELPDNWALNKSYNLPLDEFMNLMASALEKGYSLGWDGDVSEKSFSQKKGVATLPKLEWAMRTQVERDSLLLKPEPEMRVDQALRQKMFDNYQTTDDHLMHITGLSQDQNGTRYFITKNSWGTKDHKLDGYIHMSEQYVRAKTISFMVHKDAVSKSLKKKMKQR